MPRKTTLTERAQQRLRNSRFHLRKLLRQGRLSDAAEYAARLGLALDPTDAAQTGGAGVRPAPGSENINTLTPGFNSFPKTDPAPETGPGSDPVPVHTPSGPAPVFESALARTRGRKPRVPTPTPPQARIPTVHGTVPVAVVHRTKEITDLAGLWRDFVARLKRNGASSVMAWEEFEQLDIRLCFAAKQEQVIEQIGRQIEERKLYTDPVGTIEAVIVKEPPNRFIRVVQLPDRSEGVVWVQARFSVPVGQSISIVPNEDERGGWLQVGQYGKRGGRVR